jgi:hypothetical protein
MLLLMTDTPPHVVGVRAVGKVNEVEYETILLPALEKAVKQYGKLNYIMVLETSVGNFTAGAWVNDIKAGLKYYAQWEKIAIVTDQKPVEKITDFVSLLIPGKARGFPVSDIEMAKTWVGAPKEGKGK